MRLGVGKWHHRFQFPFFNGRNEEFGTDPTPIKANDKMSIDFHENMVDLLWLHCFLFSNFILCLESLCLVSSVDNSFNLLQRNPFQSYILVRFRLTLIACSLKAKPMLKDQAVLHHYGIFVLFSNCLIKKKRILKGDL